MASVIRAATVLDAEGISRVILAALRHSNAADYDAATLARVARSFTPQAVVALLDRRVVWVALEGGLIVATAGLEKDVVRSVFVDPTYQRRGIGEQMMGCIEQEALDSGGLAVAGALFTHCSRFLYQVRLWGGSGSPPWR